MSDRRSPNSSCSATYAVGRINETPTTRETIRIRLIVPTKSLAYRQLKESDETP